MAHAITPAAESSFIRAHPHMSYRRGPYLYRIDLRDSQALYSVTNGQQTLSIPLRWAYGTGVVGQAFVFRANGVYNEAEVAFYPVLGRLDIVAGLTRAIPATLQQAFGLPLTPEAARQCISCHTTAAVTDHQLDVKTLIRGVTCEACHGPGARHMAEMERAGNPAKPGATYIFNPARLDPPDLENFCGECHRSSLRVQREGLHGLDTVHYEPYRLEMSQCWIMTQRISCITCHNPHRPLQRDPAAYDSACLSCHALKGGMATASHPGKSCPMATRNCVTCHMPKCRLPLTPFKMSDHFIRIVSAGDPCAKS
ncbi:MAG: multiheme c-type cytochrome [Terriglobia bacterium]